MVLPAGNLTRSEASSVEILLLKPPSQAQLAHTATAVVAGKGKPSHSSLSRLEKFLHQKLLFCLQPGPVEQQERKVFYFKFEGKILSEFLRLLFIQKS